MVIILEGKERDYAPLEDIVEETAAVGIYGVGITYEEIPMSLKDVQGLINQLVFGGKLSLKADKRKGLTGFGKALIKEHNAEVAAIDAYRKYIDTRVEINRDHEIMAVRCYGDTTGYSSDYYRLSGDIVQRWQLTRVDSQTERYTDCRFAPMIHSLLRLLERCPVRGIQKADIWLETGQRIPNGFYLHGLNDGPVVLEYFEGRRDFVKRIEKDEKYNCKGPAITGNVTSKMRTIFVKKFDEIAINNSGPFYEATSSELTNEKRSGFPDVHALCLMDNFPKNTDYYSHPFDTFRWAADSLQGVSKLYDSVIKKQRAICKE